MRKLYILLLFLPVIAFSQSRNYIRTTVYNVPFGPQQPIPPADNQMTVGTTYFDGLGRPIQKVAHKQSADGHDIITPIFYDTITGRQPKEYLPYPSTTSSLEYVDNATVIGNSYYSQYGAEGNTPFSEKKLEDSPMGTLLKQGAPGTTWAINHGGGSDHSVKFEHQTNLGPSSSSGRVRKYLIQSELNTATLVYGPDSWVLPYAPNWNGTEYYAAGELYKTVTKDENWVSGTDNTTEEFKDKEGKLILKRTYAKSADANGNDGSTSVVHETYYIYDQFGNLTVVSPPMSTGIANSSSLVNLCYRYYYDARNRLAEKKLPQKQSEYLVYDKLDRIVATGPAAFPFPVATSTGWLLTKYDAYSRVAFTGWVSSGGVAITSAVRKTMQDFYNGVIDVVLPGTSTVDGVQIYYAATPLPVGFKLLTVNYYDDYRFLPSGTLPADVEEEPVLTTSPSLIGLTAKGLQTGSWVRVLTKHNETFAETNYTLYDAKSRPIRTYTKNHMGGYTYTDSKLRFTGLPDYTITRHKRINTNTELTIKDVFTYTDQQRLDKHTHEIVGIKDPELMSLNEYSLLGELKNKKVGGLAGVPGDFYQSVDYTYNIRGWLTDINKIDSTAIAGMPDDLFAFKIAYNDPVVAANALFNGNISETTWKTGGETRRYDYNYDPMNRLKKATYSREGVVTHSYDEQISYDKNGNIRKLLRNGLQDDPTEPIEMDNLSYVYSHGTNSNQLLAVNDASLSSSGFKDGAANNQTDYKYDAYGNLIFDENKGITQILYNHLNLPKNIVFGGSGESIEYVYNALGVKLKKTVVANLTPDGSGPVDYLQGFQYMNGNLQFFPTAEGYVDCTQLNGATVYNYVYQYKDHLGNIRVNYTKDLGEVKIKQEQHYYPFGLQHQNYGLEDLDFKPVDDNFVALQGRHPIEDLILKLPYNYKYNGKEYQDELGLNMYDYGARNYDPALGRWMNMDPLAEQLYSNTPYNYVSNNPLNFIDPDGRSGIGTLDEKNKTVTISSTMYFYGGGASKQQATDTAANIQKLWNAAGGTIDIDGVTYSVQFAISGEYVSEQDATDMAKNNGSNAENNFVRVEDGSQLGFKSSFYDTPGNSGYYIGSELKNGSTDAHEYGHGLGWYEAREADGGRHDATVDNGVPGIMSPRGTPVSDQYGYGGQPAGQKTMSPYRRGVLASDITKLNIDTKTLKASGTVNVGTATNNIYNANGTVKTP